MVGSKIGVSKVNVFVFAGLLQIGGLCLIEEKVPQILLVISCVCPCVWERERERVYIEWKHGDLSVHHPHVWSANHVYPHARARTHARTHAHARTHTCTRACTYAKARSPILWKLPPPPLPPSFPHPTPFFLFSFFSFLFFFFRNKYGENNQKKATETTRLIRHGRMEVGK